MGSSASCTRTKPAQVIAPRDPAATALTVQGGTPPSEVPKKQLRAKRKKQQKRNPNWPERLLTTGVVGSKQPPRRAACMPPEEATDSDDDDDSSPLSPESRRNSAGSSVFSADEEAALGAATRPQVHSAQANIGNNARHTSKAGLKDSRVAHPVDASGPDPAGGDGGADSQLSARSEAVPAPAVPSAPPLDTACSSSSPSVSSEPSGRPKTTQSRLTMRRKTIVDAEVSRGISKLVDAARKAQAVSALSEGARAAPLRTGADGTGRAAPLSSDAFTHALLHA